MITAHVEPLEPFLPELKQIFPAHYEELALNKEHVPLSPQYWVYLEREKRGELLFVVLRDAGKIIGYLVGFIAPGLHYSTCLTCITDIFYVCPEYRKQGGGMLLFQAVEKELRRRKVQRWFMGSKKHKESTFLFEKIGAELCETTHTKWLGD